MMHWSSKCNLGLQTDQTTNATPRNKQQEGREIWFWKDLFKIDYGEKVNWKAGLSRIWWLHWSSKCNLGFPLKPFTAASCKLHASLVQWSCIAYMLHYMLHLKFGHMPCWVHSEVSMLHLKAPHSVICTQGFVEYTVKLHHTICYT